MSVIPATIGDIPPEEKAPDMDETTAEKRIEERYPVGSVLAHASVVFVYEKVQLYS